MGGVWGAQPPIRRRRSLRNSLFIFHSVVDPPIDKNSFPKIYNTQNLTNTFTFFLSQEVFVGPVLPHKHLTLSVCTLTCKEYPLKKNGAELCVVFH